MIPVLYHSILSRLMTLLGSLSGSASRYKETACGNSPVVHLLLCSVSGVSPAGLPQPRGTRELPDSEYGVGESERGVVLLSRKDPEHGLQHCGLGRFDLWETPLFQPLGPAW